MEGANLINFHEGTNEDKEDVDLSTHEDGATSNGKVRNPRILKVDCKTKLVKSRNNVRRIMIQARNNNQDEMKTRLDDELIKMNQLWKEFGDLQNDLIDSLSDEEDVEQEFLQYEIQEQLVNKVRKTVHEFSRSGDCSSFKDDLTDITEDNSLCQVSFQTRSKASTSASLSSEGLKRLSGHEDERTTKEQLGKIRLDKDSQPLLNPEAPEWYDSGRKPNTLEFMFSKQIKFMEQVMNQQQQSSLTLTLPKPDMPTFDGDPTEYCNFIRAFDTVIASRTNDDSANLYYLIQYTTGDVKELLKGFLAKAPEEGYREARLILKKRFGQDYKIATAYVEKATTGPAIMNEDNKGLQKFSTLLTCCKNTLQEIGYISKIENPDSLRKIISRLPFDSRKRWRTKADHITEYEDREVTFADISDFVEREARIANHPVFGNVSNQTKNNSLQRNFSNQHNDSSLRNIKHHTGRPSKSSFVSKAENTKSSMNSPTTLDCLLCHKDHNLEDCATFKDKTTEERRKFAFENAACFNCLRQLHRARRCNKKGQCETCQGRHSTLLHTDQHKSAQPLTNGFVTNDSTATIGLPIVPVIVRGKGNSYSRITHAFLDNGSTGTFCTDGLLDKLKINGERSKLSLTTLDKKNHEVECRTVDLEVYSLDEENFMELSTVFSRPTLPISDTDIPRQVDIERWPHLNRVRIPTIDTGVELLIGNDNCKALEPKEVIQSKDGSPFAVRNILGWVLNGPLDRISPRNGCTSNFIKVNNSQLEEQFTRYCNLEFNDAIDSSLEMSKEDKRAIAVYEASTVLKDGHYQVALPWKDSVPPSLPNNLPMVTHRLQLLFKRLMKNPDLHEKYSMFMEGLLKNRYAEVVPKEEIHHQNLTWYIPHHPVVHPRKLSKVRVVFDCGAKYHSESLNNCLLRGPDLINSLVGVLTRFRQQHVALMGDIESMFHQVHIQPNHRDALRFLWWPEGNLSKEPIHYRMRSCLFGSISSPSICNYILKKTADDNQQDFDQEVIDTVKQNFYVDDCLKSVKSEDEAINLVKNLTELLKRGGFRLTKWSSNSRTVLESIPESERSATTKNLDLDDLPIERTLGILWNTNIDKFTFQVTLRSQPATRRGILSITSSIFDPTGFTAPVMLPAKMILQELCQLKLGWDDPLPQPHLDTWNTWLEELPRLSEFSIDRCLLKSLVGYEEMEEIQLHHFSDASEKGYGAVSYIRMIDKQKQIHCAFLMGKSRVAPLKTMTIPRLELAAATVSIRLDRLLRRELNLKSHIQESTYWCDSTAVLSYIRNENRRFQTYVANRLAVIHEASAPNQWRHVDGKNNPADEASRGLTVGNFLKNHRWTMGPEFLWRPESEWMESCTEVIDIATDDPELKKVKTCLVTINRGNDDIIEEMVTKYSSYYKLKKIVALVLYFIRKIKNAYSKRKKGETVEFMSGHDVLLKVSDLREGEKLILQSCQKINFPDEIESATKGDSCIVKKTSPLRKLNPVMINGLLCVGGRLTNSPALSEECKHQIILPKKAHITKLILSHHHIISGHSGREYVLASVRQRFWPIGGNSMIRKLVSKCIPCRKRQANVCQQRMSDLPENRVTADLPPFSYVGVDYFGPLLVRRGRSDIKRYGCIFTCLCCRAIHIEIAHSLDTSSFIDALRRFNARRGSPIEIRSDNGTNFIGAEREIKEAIDLWNLKKINEFCLQQQIVWNFNPPAASHFGGVWERCIRTIRKILGSLLKEQKIDDESLLTIMCEVEAIVNGRPLTNVSEDHNDLEALTPNHLLLLRPGKGLPPGIFTKEDQYQYTKRRWRQVQYLANIFWRRWTREYLPMLQSRQKWTDNHRDLKVGDIVLVVDHQLPRGSWPLGRIVEVFPGNDGSVRVVRVKTKDNILSRPIQKCVLLETVEAAETL